MSHQRTAFVAFKSSFDQKKTISTNNNTNVQKLKSVFVLQKSDKLGLHESLHNKALLFFAVTSPELKTLGSVLQTLTATANDRSYIVPARYKMFVAISLMVACTALYF